MLLRVPPLPIQAILASLLATGFTILPIRLPHAVGMTDPIPPAPHPGTLRIKLMLLGRKPPIPRSPLRRIQCLDTGSPARRDEF